MLIGPWSWTTETMPNNNVIIEVPAAVLYANEK
jgi:hypothetical protein